MRHSLTIVQVLVSLGCLAWLWAKPEIHEGLVEAVQQAEPKWVWLGLTLAGGVVAFGIVRWQLFLRLQGISLSWSEVTKLSLIGGFFNLILIGTVGGDAVKILYLIRRFPDKRSQAVASILMDHLCGLPAVVCLYGVFCGMRWDWLAGSGLSSQLALFAGVYLAGAVVGIGLLLVIALFDLTSRTPEGLPFRAQAVKFSKALMLFLKDWRITLAGVGLSFVIHGLYFGTFYAGALAMNAGVSLTEMFTIMPVVDVITTLPISISGLGLRETLFESFLERLCQVPSEIGVMVSLLGFGFSVFWSLLGGLVFPFCWPGSAKSLWHVLIQAREEADSAA